MNDYIFKNLYGEKPHRDKTKWNRDAGLNSYNILLNLTESLVILFL